MGTATPNSSAGDAAAAPAANLRFDFLDPSAGLIDTAARAILDGSTPPDLSGQIVLVADFGAAPGLRAALGRAAAARGFAAVFAPRVTTLQAWAAGTVLEREVSGARERCFAFRTDVTNTAHSARPRLPAVSCLRHRSSGSSRSRSG